MTALYPSCRSFSIMAHLQGQWGWQKARQQLLKPFGQLKAGKPAPLPPAVGKASQSLATVSMACNSPAELAISVLIPSAGQAAAECALKNLGDLPDLDMCMLTRTRCCEDAWSRARRVLSRCLCAQCACMSATPRCR